MSALPTISLIVAVYNGASTLQRLLDSIAAQTFRDFELIIMDGGSSDGSVDLLRQNQDLITKWHSEPDEGLYHAWNKALACAQGTWIAFLGADDFLWQPTALEGLVPALRTAEGDGVRVVYGSIKVVNKHGEAIDTIGRPWPEIRQLFRQEMCLPHPGLMHHRSLFAERGMYDQSFKIAADYELLLRELRERPACFVPNHTVAGWTIGGISSDRKNLARMLREVARAKRQNGLSVMPRYWGALPRAMIRHVLFRVVGEAAVSQLAALYRRSTGKGVCP